MAIEAGIDTHELSELAELMYRTANDRYPKEVKSFLREQGGEGAKLLKAETRSVIKGHRKRTTGAEKKQALLKGIKKSKVTKHNGDYQIRVLSTAYHAHLIEYGHVEVDWGRRTEKYIPGKYPMEAARKALDASFPGEVERFVDGLIKEGFEL